MGKCPFNGHKKCNTECVLYRRGLRYFDGNKTPTPFEECAFNIIADSLENMVSRSIGEQTAIEQVRNEVSMLNNLFHGLVEERKALNGGSA